MCSAAKSSKRVWTAGKYAWPFAFLIMRHPTAARYSACDLLLIVRLRRGEDAVSNAQREKKDGMPGLTILAAL